MTKARDTADINSGTNTAAGEDALENNTASNNTAVGYQAGLNVTTGTLNTLVGSGAGGNATMTGSENNLLGYIAGRNITSGQYNTGIGSYSINSLTTGSGNIAMGRSSLGSTTTGNSNVAVGFDALQANTNAFNNTALGYRAGYLNTTGTNNTFIGTNAGYANTTAFANTFIGDGSGDLVTTGYRNTILGMFNGNQGGLDMRTYSNQIVLSDGSGNPRLHINSNGKMHIRQSVSSHMILAENGNTNYGSIGIASHVNRTASGGNYFFFSARDTSAGQYKFYVRDDGDVKNVSGNYGAMSDRKLKENISDASSQWEDIKALTVRKYSMKADNLDVANMLGVIAQEVEEAGMTNLVDDEIDRDDDGNALGTSTKSFKYSILYMKAVKALQEAMTRIETLETKVATLEG